MMIALVLGGRCWLLVRGYGRWERSLDLVDLPGLHESFRGDIMCHFLLFIDERPHWVLHFPLFLWRLGGIVAGWSGDRWSQKAVGIATFW